MSPGCVVSHRNLGLNEPKAARKPRKHAAVAVDTCSDVPVLGVVRICFHCDLSEISLI